MASAKLTWRGDVQMGRNCTVYGQKVIQAVRRVADYWSPILESYAKREAKWTDRSGAARQSLHSWVIEVANDACYLFLAHGVFYGRFLEAKYQFSIIWPALQAHIEPIMQMLKDIFG